MRARDDMYRDQLTDTLSRRRPGIRGGFARRDIAAHHGGHQAATDLFHAYQLDAGRFDHGVGGLNQCNQAPGFNHS